MTARTKQSLSRRHLAAWQCLPSRSRISRLEKKPAMTIGSMHIGREYTRSSTSCSSSRRTARSTIISAHFPALMAPLPVVFPLAR